MLFLKKGLISGSAGQGLIDNHMLPKLKGNNKLSFSLMACLEECKHCILYFNPNSTENLYTNAFRNSVDLEK